MKPFAWAGVLLAALFAWMAPASAQLPQVPQCQQAYAPYAYVPCVGAVTVVPPATSTPLVGTASTSGFVGPWTPQLGRTAWLTVSGTWTGNVFIYATIDGVCADGALVNAGPNYSAGFVGVSGQNATASVGVETRANVGWCLNFTINSGSVAYRLAN